MKKLAIIVAVIVVLIIVAIFVVPPFLDINKYHDRIEAELRKALGRPVTLGNMRASLTPPSVRIQNVVVGEDARFGTGPFAQAQELDVSVKLWPLILHKQVEVRSLQLENPRVELIRNREGVWNYSSLGQQPQQAAAPAPPSPQPQARPAPQPQAKPQAKPSPAKPAPEQQPETSRSLEIASLQISNGQVTLIDEQKNFRGAYNNIDLTLKNFAPGQPFDVDAALRLPGRGAEQVRLVGKVGPLPQGQSNALVPFDGRLQMNQVSLADLQKLVNTPALQGINGIASGQLNAHTTQASIAADGSLKLDGARIRGVDVGYPITLDFRAAEDTNSGVAKIEHATLHLGQTPITMAGTINTKPTPMELDVHVTASNASIAEAARLASAFGVAFNPGTNVAGRLNADISARGAASSPALNGTVNARDVQISGGTVKQPVSVPAIELALSPSAVRSSAFTASTGHTALNIQFALTNYSSPSPGVQATLRTNNANIGELLSIARAYGVSAVDGINGSGLLTLDVNASGPLKNASAMVFSGSGLVKDASLTMPSLTKPLNVRNANISFNQNSMTLNNLSASLDQTNANGQIAIRNFAAPVVQFTLTADKVNVASLQQVMAPAQNQPAPARAAANWSLLPRAYAQTPSQPSLLTKATGGGTVTIGSVIYDQLVLNNVHANVALDHGIIRLSPLTSTLYGGQQTGAIVLDTRVTPMAVNVSTKLQHVEANQLISSVTSLKQTLYGLLAANANTQFKATSAADIPHTLNGTLALDLNNGRIAGMDLLNQLSQVGRFLNPAAPPKPQPFTDVLKLSGNFNVVDGVAQTNNLRMLIPGASLAANGTVNLATNALNMNLTAVLSKDLSQKVGGTGIGGFMQTALANNQGELVLPVLVTGSFASPQFAPNMEEVARMKLQNLVPNSSNPGQLTNGILGAVLGGNRGNAGQQQQRQGGLQGIVGAITGQQQQQQQPQPQQNPPAAGSPQQPQQPQQQNPSAQQPPDQQQQQQDALQQLLGNVLNKKKKQQQQQQQQQQPQQQPPK